MKKYIKIIFTLIFCQYALPSFSQQAIDTNLYQPSVLIENFTSEGCGSCPEADKFMAELIHLSDSTNNPVTIIDFHVDIWNRSGWVDPLSDSIFSQRQRTYLAKNKLEAVYTPMAVCNGNEIWPGMAKKEIGRFIGKSLTKPSKHFIRVASQMAPGEDSLTVAYALWGNPDSCLINVALVQQDLINKITSGENANKTLHHHNVVKFFYTRLLKGVKGEYKIGIPHGLDLTKYRLITYIQKENTWEVLCSDQLFFDVRK
jgi:hypothetical protein